MVDTVVERSSSDWWSGSGGLGSDDVRMMVLMENAVWRWRRRRRRRERVSVLLLRVVVVGMFDGLVMFDGGLDGGWRIKEGRFCSPHQTSPNGQGAIPKRGVSEEEFCHPKIHSARTGPSSTSKVQHASLPVSADTKLSSCDPSKHGHSRSSPVA